MSALDQLEETLDDIFVKNAPELPARGKEALIRYLPWINLILGILTLWSVYWLWHWAHYANAFIDYANRLSAAYGGPTVHRFTVGIWLSIAVLAVEAVIYLLAFQATRERRKSGWNLMFYAVLINIVYGVVVMFTDYGGIGTFIGTLIGSAIGLYFLFQIRAGYSKHPATHSQHRV